MDGMRNKVAIVTGGVSGIGRATALALADEGIRIVIADVVEQEIQQIGGFRQRLRIYII